MSKQKCRKITGFLPFLTAPFFSGHARSDRNATDRTQRPNKSEGGVVVTYDQPPPPRPIISHLLLFPQRRKKPDRGYNTWCIKIKQKNTLTNLSTTGRSANATHLRPQFAALSQSCDSRLICFGLNDQPFLVREKAIFFLSILTTDSCTVSKQKRRKIIGFLPFLTAPIFSCRARSDRNATDRTQGQTIATMGE